LRHRCSGVPRRPSCGQDRGPGRVKDCSRIRLRSGSALAGAVMTEPAGTARLREALTELRGMGEVVVLPDTVHTAALAAEALGCEVGAIANSLLFDADGIPVLILTSGAHRVNVAATAERIGVASLVRATPEF